MPTIDDDIAERRRCIPLVKLYKTMFNEMTKVVLLSYLIQLKLLDLQLTVNPGAKQIVKSLICATDVSFFHNSV